VISVCRLDLEWPLIDVQFHLPASLYHLELGLQILEWF